MALVAGAARGGHVPDGAVAGRLYVASAVDADRPDRRGWLGFCCALRERVASPLRTLASLLEAMREGDYSIRARGIEKRRCLGEVMQQVNAMAPRLRAQRLGALEATALLRKVMEEIDVAIFAFDGEQRLRLVNRAGERLLIEPSERLLDASRRSCWDLGRFLEGEAQRTDAADVSRRNGALGIEPQLCFAKADCRISWWWSPT